MKNLIFFFAICIISSNCNNESNNENKKDSFTLESTNDSIYIKLGEKELNHTFLNQYFLENDSNYLAILNIKRHSIYVYNLDQQKLHKEILVKNEGTDAFPGLFGYVIKNMDTIILISNIPSRIGIFNGQEKIIKKISYEKDVSGKMLFPGIPLFAQKGVLTGNILNITQVLYIPKYSGKVTSNVQKQSNVAIEIDIENSSVKSLPLNFPMELVGKDIFGMEFCREQGYNNCFVYIFPMMDDLFVTQEFSEFKKIPIETDYDLKLPENLFKYQTDMQGGIKYKMNRDGLHNILYDKYRECYYILVKKRVDDNTKQNEVSRTNLIYPDCFIIILDKDFKHLGDVYFPKNTYSFNDMFITKKGVYISEDHIDNHSYSEDAMRFRLFKLKKL